MSAYAQEYGYFFNSNNDRTYNAESFEAWLKPFFVSGVFAGCLQVKAQSTPDMTVYVTPGYANLDGKPAYWPTNNTMALSVASGVYPRIDTIVLRRDNTNRAISIEVVTGTASSSPQPTAPTRNNDTFELVLAEVYVAAGVTSVTQSNITDKRPDTDVCGYVMCTIETPDFSELYDQFLSQCEDTIEAEEDDFDDLLTAKQATFELWFQNLHDELDSNQAAHLQNEIYDTQEIIAARWIPGTTYDPDDYVVYGNDLYKRIGSTGHEITWDSSLWEQVIITDKIKIYDKLCIKSSNRLTVPANALTTFTFPGLTDGHELVRWNFYDGTSLSSSTIEENNPPADLTWITAIDSLVIINSSSSVVYCEPVFVKPGII